MVGRLAKRTVALTALGVALAGCAVSGRVAHSPRVPPCRTVVSAGGDGSGALPEVRWIAPALAEDRQVLHAWCETVGGVVADTAPARPDPGGIDSLAVVTWNARVGGGDLPRLVDSLRAGEEGRVRRIAHRFGSDHHPLVGWFPVPRDTAACAAPGDAAP